MSCDAELILGSTLRTVEAARRIVSWYGGDFAPLRTDQLAELLRRSGCHVEVFPFRSSVTAMALPPYRGRYPILLNRTAQRTDRMFALRHELAHVLAGDVEEATFLASEGYMSKEERAADLFALVDLLPTWLLRLMRRQRLSWGAIAAEIRHGVGLYGGDWPKERVADRTALRIRLFNELGM